MCRAYQAGDLPVKLAAHAVSSRARMEPLESRDLSVLALFNGIHTLPSVLPHLPIPQRSVNTKRNPVYNVGVGRLVIWHACGCFIP